MLAESATEIVGVIESAAITDLFDGQIGVAKQLAGMF